MNHKRLAAACKMFFQWKDGSTRWKMLKDLKESNPVEVAEYANVKKVKELACIWWANNVLNKYDCMIAKVESCYWIHTHKFGVLIPVSVKEALQLDDKTGTDLWQKTIKKEMKHVMPAFKFLEQDKQCPLVIYILIVI